MRRKKLDGLIESLIFIQLAKQIIMITLPLVMPMLRVQKLMHERIYG